MGKPSPVFGLQDVHRFPLNKAQATNYRQALAKFRRPTLKPKRSSGDLRSLFSTDNNRILVIYDDWSQWRYVGGLYGEQMSDLLSHYGYAVDMLPAQNYTAGLVDTYRATIYMGTLYDTDLPTDFLNDVRTTTQPVCWMGYNLWRMAWNTDYSDNPAFAEQFGYRFSQLDMGYNTVAYKGQVLGKLDTSLALLEVTDPSKVEVLATSTNPDGDERPYIIRSGNFWYVGDNPLSTVAYANQPRHDRLLAFCDVMHDFLQDGVTEEDHKALVRIEDVSASADPAKLREIADILSGEGVPFVVSTIPIYRDPLGYWTQGEPYEVSLADSPEVVDALRYMVSKGGQIIQHGYTHQYEDIPNPYYGISGSDWEFFRVVKNDQGDLENWGPVWEDSYDWATQRIQAGRDLLAGIGFDVTGWLTPHYLASPVDYQVFADNYSYSLCPTTNFTIDDAGYLFFLNLYVPFTTRDHLGMVHLPETAGFLSPGTPYMTPDDVITRAEQVKVVRDGWLGFFFHPYLDPELLRTAVQGVKAKGYTFINPSVDYAPTVK